MMWVLLIHVRVTSDVMHLVERLIESHAPVLWHIFVALAMHSTEFSNIAIDVAAIVSEVSSSTSPLLVHSSMTI